MTINRPGEGHIVHDPEVRKHTYDTAIAIAALLVAAGFLTPDEAQLWLNLGAAALGLLGTLLARFNVPRGKHAGG